MNFTFGIITNGDVDQRVKDIVESIRAQHIPNYEIIIVGKTEVTGSDICNLFFDESKRANWITRKKNLICQKARYENIVLLHDYVLLCNGWYEGFLKFGSNYDICINQIKTADGNRFRDYTLFGEALSEPFNQRSLLPYDYTLDVKLAPLSYISGSYYVVKKYISLKYPLNEKLGWCQCEDLEFCQRLHDANIKISCNPNSIVCFLKEKPQMCWENTMTIDDIHKLENLSNTELNQIKKSINNFLECRISHLLQ